MEDLRAISTMKKDEYWSHAILELKVCTYKIYNFLVSMIGL